MKQKILLLIVLLIILISCSPQDEPNLQATIDVLNTSQAELPEENITEIINTPIPTATQRPTETPIPTSTPTNEPTQDSYLAKAKNFVASEEQNGVLIEVERILICDKYWDDIYKDYSEEPIFDDKTTYIEFIFRVTNNTDKIIWFNFSDTIASANGEQISLYDFVYSDYYWGWGDDDLDEDILPGSMVRGFTWTGVKRSTWDEIDKIIISIPNAYDNDYNSVTDNFLFEIEVGDWGFEPIIED